jgi:hypothetical protein
MMSWQALRDTALDRLGAMRNPADHAGHTALERLRLMGDPTYDAPNDACRAMLQRASGMRRAMAKLASLSDRRAGEPHRLFLSFLCENFGFFRGFLRDLLRFFDRKLDSLDHRPQHLFDRHCDRRRIAKCEAQRRSREMGQSIWNDLMSQKRRDHFGRQRHNDKDDNARNRYRAQGAQKRMKYVLRRCTRYRKNPTLQLEPPLNRLDRKSLYHRAWVVPLL